MMPISGKAVNTPGAFRCLVGLAGTTVTLYRNHVGLFWRVMMPVIIVAILFNIAMFFRAVPIFEDTRRQWKIPVDWNVNTVNGISVTNYPKPEPGVSWELNLKPTFRLTGDKDIIWIWQLDFRGFEYSLLLLTMCPLSFAVAQLYHCQKITAREVWHQVLRRIWTILAANLLFVLIVDTVPLLYQAVLSLIPQYQPWYRIFSFVSHPYLFMFIVILSPCYFLVTFSLYNPCLILENRSAIAIFRRSYELVKGSWWRFFGIYLATAWIASVLTSVLLGLALLMFSVVLPELAPVQAALLPVGLFTLFLGGDVEIALGPLPSVLTTTVILIVRGLISAFLVPIWAIVTTYLYLEKVNRKLEETC